MMNYIYKNGFAIGRMLGDREILFITPIASQSWRTYLPINSNLGKEGN